MMNEKWDCLKCPKSFETERGLHIHFAIKHKDTFRKVFPLKQRYKKTIPDYDQDTLNELEEISNLNLVRYVDGDISKMSSSIKRSLYKAGILKSTTDRNPIRGMKGGGSQYKFTEKGLDVLNRLKSE